MEDTELIEAFHSMIKQAISVCEQALCQLTVCFEFQGRSERRKQQKSCALQMEFTSEVPS